MHGDVSREGDPAKTGGSCNARCEGDGEGEFEIGVEGASGFRYGLMDKRYSSSISTLWGESGPPDRSR